MLAGNYGPPICGAASKTRDLDWLVVEVSSFQLETVQEFRPRVGVLMNIQPDHLDRHGSMARYTDLKRQVFARMGRGDTAIVPDDLLTRIAGSSARAAAATAGASTSREAPRWVTFGQSPAADYRYLQGQASIRRGSAERTLSVRSTMFDNEILGAAAAAAAAAIDACGLPWAALEAAMAHFEPLPHRMQEIARIRGICFVNDSKATNLAALGAALRMVGGNVRLIAGGRLKEKDLSPAKDLLAKKVRRAYLIGEAQKAMVAGWGGVVDCLGAGTLENAVRQAWRDAEAGDTVLLSPGCASFDQFRNFEHRGEEFARIVRMLDDEDK